MAPEIIQSDLGQGMGYGHAVDWYAVGIMIYELMYGRPPFMVMESQNPMEFYQKIITSKIKFPRNFDEGAKSLIRHLTEHDLSKRYGNLKKGIEQIKSHRFFE